MLWRGEPLANARKDTAEGAARAGWIAETGDSRCGSGGQQWDPPRGRARSFPFRSAGRSRQAGADAPYFQSAAAVFAGASGREPTPTWRRGGRSPPGGRRRGGAGETDTRREVDRRERLRGTSHVKWRACASVALAARRVSGAPGAVLGFGGCQRRRSRRHGRAVALGASAPGKGAHDMCGRRGQTMASRS